MSAATDERDLIKLAAASERYSVPYSQLLKGIHSGDLPAIRPFGPWLVDPADVRAFLNRRHEEREEAEATR